ncbi:PEP-CTERM sorting domain-containing protein [Marinobacter sp. 1Y8]
MFRLVTVLLLLACGPVSASLIQYDYAFAYTDVTDCSASCSPAPEGGTGSLMLDTDQNALLALSLSSADFDVNWTGNLQLTPYADGWPVDDGDLMSANIIFTDSGYNVDMFLDLFFVPTAGNPLDYFENAVEQYNYLGNGDRTWFFQGNFTKGIIAQVPEPASGILLALGLMLVGFGRIRRRIG